MALFSQNQNTDIMISNDASDVVVTNSTGGTIVAGSGLLLKQLLADGTYRNSGAIKASEVIYVSKAEAVTAVGSSVTATPTVGGVGTAHSFIVEVSEVGSKSFEDKEFFQGQYVEVAGDTAITIAEGIVENLAAGFKNLNPSTGKKSTVLGTGGSTISIWDNPLFSFAVNLLGEIVVTEKMPQKYSRGHISYERVIFTGLYKIYDGVNSDDYTTVTVTKVDGAQNPLDARRVADLEYFAMGNYGDLYDTAGAPYNLEREYIANPKGTYLTSYLIQYGSRGAGMSAGDESEATLQIFCTAADTAGDALAIETALETALGITIPAAGGIVQVR